MYTDQQPWLAYSMKLESHHARANRYVRVMSSEYDCSILSEPARDNVAADAFSGALEVIR